MKFLKHMTYGIIIVFLVHILLDVNAIEITYEASAVMGFFAGILTLWVYFED